MCDKEPAGKMPDRGAILLWVTGCRRDYVAVTTGVPQIADDSLQHRRRQSRANSGHLITAARVHKHRAPAIPYRVKHSTLDWPSPIATRVVLPRQGRSSGDCR